MLNESIIKIRCELQKKEMKKSGKNKFAGFEYFELADFLPTLNELMLWEGVNDRFYIKDNIATLELIKGEERQEYTIPFIMFDTPLNKNGQPSMQDIQYLGALNTYYKRYLYLNAFGITDGDVIDSLNNDELDKPKKTKKTKTVEYITEEQKDIMFKQLGLPTTSVCAYCGVDDINMITYAQAEDIITKKTK